VNTQKCSSECSRDETQDTTGSNATANVEREKLWDLEPRTLATRGMVMENRTSQETGKAKGKPGSQNCGTGTHPRNRGRPRGNPEAEPIGVDISGKQKWKTGTAKGKPGSQN
jgi:hypothetical protein